jgi:hypothetical protein
VPWTESVVAADRSRLAVVDCHGTESVVTAVAEMSAELGIRRLAA